MPKKIVQLVGCLAAGGAEIFAVDLAVEMKRQGLDVTVVAIVHSRDALREFLERRLVQNRVRYHCLDKPLSSMSVWAALRYITILRNLKPDVVHSHCPSATAVNRYLTRFSCPDAKRVCTIHNVVERPIFIRMLDVMGFRSCFDKIVCVSQPVYNTFPDNQQKTIIHVTKDLFAFLHSDEERDLCRRQLGLSPRGLVFLHAGGMGDDRKNQTALLRGFTRLDSRLDAMLLLVGDGKSRVGLEYMARSLNLSYRVRFCGIRSDMARLFAASDVFVFPSLYEGRPLAALEAMVSGLPCLFSPIPPLIGMGENVSGVHFLPGTSANDVYEGLAHAKNNWWNPRWRRALEERKRIYDANYIGACVREYLGPKGYDLVR